MLNDNGLVGFFSWLYYTNAAKGEILHRENNFFASGRNKSL